jgi:SAM-dependent methyltransferase
MDTRTLDAYDRAPDTYAAEWDEQPAASDLHALLTSFFSPGPTADVGCGSGRETAWLNENDFQATGYDPSLGLLAQARHRYPMVPFEQAALPGLDGIAAESFTNVLCETVIMHLAPGDIARSVRRLLDILAPGGTLCVSWRVTEGVDQRDDQGRLYAAFEPSLVTDTLSSATILHDTQVRSASSGKTVRRVLARRPSRP